MLLVFFRGYRWNWFNPCHVAKKSEQAPSHSVNCCRWLLNMTTSSSSTKLRTSRTFVPTLFSCPPTVAAINFDTAAGILVSSPTVLAKKPCHCRADPSQAAAALSPQTLSLAEKKRRFTDCLICASATSAMLERRACHVYRSSPPWDRLKLGPTQGRTCASRHLSCDIHGSLAEPQLFWPTCRRPEVQLWRNNNRGKFRVVRRNLGCITHVSLHASQWTSGEQRNRCQAPSAPRSTTAKGWRQRVP